MDQSFSAENFRRIWDLRTRRGEDLLSFFPTVHKITNEIRDYRVPSGAVTTTSGVEHSDPISNEAVRNLRTRRRIELQAQLRLVSSGLNAKIDSQSFTFGLQYGPSIRGRKTYRVNTRDPEVYFASRQVEWNLQRAFRVIQPNRNLIVEQVVRTLEDSLPKLVVRADLAQFFESIPHDHLLDVVTQASRLSATTRSLVRQLIAEYAELTGSFSGIPRGLGLSATLAEVYLQRLDQNLRTMPGLLLYGRYVDDIVLVFVGDSLNPSRQDRQKQIRKSVRDLHLKLNSAKTRYYDLPISGNKKSKISLLGYEITATSDAIHLDISKPRLDRYHAKIDTAISCFLSNRTHPAAFATLNGRLRFLTGNSRLANNKRQALIGTHFSNPLINNVTPRFQQLDAYLEQQIATLPIMANQKTALSKHKFATGVSERTFWKMSDRQMARVTKVWRNF